MNRLRKILSILIIFALVLPFGACKKGDEEEVIPADYGDYGAEFARDFASKYPFRYAYTDGELQAGKMIEDEFEDLGYKVEKQPFAGLNGQTSYNYYIKIEGKGFIDQNLKSSDYTVKRVAVIGAHYDTPLSQNEAGLTDYDGISDNASGIGCLMTCAKEISNYNDIGFDVYIVAFGAGCDNYTGAKAFYDGLSQSDKDALEVMYNFDSIYAGDKMYASSGFNSLNLDQKYKMRRKLYQVYDVAYDKELASRNGYSLLYNESGIYTDLNEDTINDVYSEVSLNKSDYVVFDHANVPVVFFDSYDYFFTSIDEMKETKNLNLQQYGGKVRGTTLDSSAVLDPILVTDESDKLEVRINNTAFVVLESLMKGSDYGLTYEQYQEALIEETKEDEE